MTELFSLGKLYVSDFLAPGEEPRAAPADLTLVMDDDTGIVHLAEQPPAELMWGKYWYRSGTNQSMTSELGGIVKSIERVTRLEPGDLWVDIASNDGTLLAAVNPDLIRVGVDPVEGEINAQALAHADLLVQSPFSLSIAERLSSHGQRAKVVTCIAMFYDLPDPTDFLAGVQQLLDRDGLFVLQLSYTPLMLRQLAFDNICHEHARYYTLHTLTHVLANAGFRIVDCQLNDTNGGSFRVYAMRTGADVSAFGTQPYRDVAQFRVESLLVHEEMMGVNEPVAWHRFWNLVAELRSEVVGFVVDAKARGETVWCAGASTKGNTLLQYFGLDNTMIDAIVERQPGKVGLRTVGTDIPIRSEDDFRATRPDNTLVLPWQFRAEIAERERGYLAAGGRLVFPCPRFEVVGDGASMLDGQRPA